MVSPHRLRVGILVRKRDDGAVYVVEHVDEELELAHLGERGSGRRDCAYLRDLELVSIGAVSATDGAGRRQKEEANA